MEKYFKTFSKLLIVLVSIIVFLPHQTFSTNGWTEQTGSSSRTWKDITSSTDGVKLAAIVSAGYIYTSTDSGVTWTEQTGSGSRNWASITSSSDGTKLAAVVNNWDDGSSYIYTSTDSGVSWTERQSAGSHTWQEIASSSDGTKLVAIESDFNIHYVGGYLFTSVDGGVTWTQQTDAGLRQWRFVNSSADGNTLIGFNFYPYQIVTSTDGGANWTLQVQDSLDRGNLASSSDGTKMASTTWGGSIYTSLDGGSTWVEKPNSGARTWLSMASSADGSKLAAGVRNGSLYLSRDSGSSWAEQVSAGSKSWRAIASSSDGSKLAAISSGNNIFTYALTAPILSSPTATLANDDVHAVTLNGTISDTGGDLSTTRGFQYGLTESYGTTVSENGSFGSGTFTADIDSLEIGTTYHYRSFATNSGGTTYSSDATFTTLDITISSQTIASNSPSGTTIGTVSAVTPEVDDTFTFTLSSGVGCTASDNAKFTLIGTDLKIAETTDFYTKSSYTLCLQIVNQDDATYRKDFTILVPVPETISAPSSATGISVLPDIPKIIFDEDKVIDLSAATATVSGGDRDVNIGGTTFNLEAYTAGSLSGIDVKNTAGIVVKQATRINTDQDNLIITHTETSDVELQISDETVIFGDIDADFEIKPPTDIATSSVSGIPSGFGVEKVVSVGSDTETYVFDTPVLVAFNAVYDRILMRQTNTSTWETLPQCQGTFTSPTPPIFPRSCWISDTSLRQTHIHTFHLTDFSGLNENNFGSGKQALFYEGMKRSDIRQSGYGTNKRTFADKYAQSLAEAETQNRGKAGISQFVTTTWKNNKFLRYISGRTSVAYQHAKQIQPIKFRASNPNRQLSDIQLVMRHRNKSFLTSAPKITSISDKLKYIASFLRPEGILRTASSRNRKTRASSRIQTPNMTLRSRAIVDLQKKKKEEAPVAHHSSAPQLSKSLSRIQQSQNERSERVRIDMSRRQSRPKGVLRHLQNNLFLFSDFLKTSLFDMADMLSTNLFKVFR